VAFTTAQTLVVKTTERGGQLRYNTAAAVFCVEFIKLVLAQLLLLRERPVSGQVIGISLMNWAAYGVPSIIYAINNNLNIKAIHYLGPHIFQLFSNLKLLTAAIASCLVLKTSVTSIQWVSLLLLVCALCSAQIKIFVFAETHDQVNDDYTKFLRGFFCVMITAILSGFSGVANEYLLKNMNVEISFMRKCVWLYQWGCLLNLLGAFFSKESLSMFDGFSFSVWTLIAVNACVGFSVGFLLKYFDTITKGFASCLSVLSVTLCSWLFFDAGIDVSFLLAFVVFSCSCFLYYGRHNDVLKHSRTDCVRED